MSHKELLLKIIFAFLLLIPVRNIQAGVNLCKQVTQIHDTGTMLEFNYEYGGDSDTGTLDDATWIGRPIGQDCINCTYENNLSDFRNVLTLNKIHVLDESEHESDKIGPYGSWKVQVIPFYMPDECVGLTNIDEKYACALKYYRHYMWYGKEVNTGVQYKKIIQFNTELPGPFIGSGGDLCEFYEVDDLNRTQLVNYDRFILWDWNNWCYYPDQPDRDEWCTENRFDDADDFCFQARGCADGVRIKIEEGDECWLDFICNPSDKITQFIVLQDDDGQIIRPSNDYMSDLTLMNAYDPDGDGDGLSDADEFDLGTDINNPDTDGDGISDYDEIQQGTNPLDSNSGNHVGAVLSIILLND